MKVIITAGGTGGHIYPAISIIDKIKKMDKSCEILYIGTTNRMEKDIIPNMNIDYEGIKINGLSKNPITCLKCLTSTLKGIDKCSKIMKSFKPDVVVGVGGYVTVPVVLAAHKLNIPIILHEQNSVPGKANKFLSKYANVVCVSIKDTLKYFKNGVFTGNPRSEVVLNSKIGDKSKYNLNNNKKLVLITTGSLGASSINDKIVENKELFMKKNYEILFVTGNSSYDEINSKIGKSSNIKVVPYIKDMPEVLKFTDIIISRAGATTISEILSLGLVSILIPSPYVANNHQYYNALELKNSGCGEILEEKDLTSEGLNNKIKELINDKNKYQKIKNNLGKNKTINSSEIIYQNIKELIKNERNM